jgi:hypothetical protein
MCERARTTLTDAGREVCRSRASREGTLPGNGRLGEHVTAEGMTACAILHNFSMPPGSILLDTGTG